MTVALSTSSAAYVPSPAGVGTSRAGAAPAARPGGAPSPEQEKAVAQLQAIDRKVRAHEQAHQAAGAGLAGPATYRYQKGPDGREYAVAGEVSISVSPGRTPEETIARAQQVRAAAMAPADPSPQDRAVAAQAANMAQQARLEQSQAARSEAAPGGERAGFSLQGIEAYRAQSEAGGVLIGGGVDLRA